MENYIVRIYRRSQQDSDNMLGIVEKPNSGENRTFRNFEELYSFFFPLDTAQEAASKKQIVEQRKFRRFLIKEGTLIFNAITDVGEITDISMGGLSFNSANVPEDCDSHMQVCILCGDSKLFIENIHCSKIICHDKNNTSQMLGSSESRRYSIEFANLTQSQQQQLKHIIQNHTLGES